MKRFLWKAIPTVLFAMAVAIQLFGPNQIGKSDNGDFPKVLGRLGVWVAPEFRPDLFSFFVTDYRIDEAHTWSPGIPGTEVWVAAVAKGVCKLLLPSGYFDIRVLGAVHGILTTLAFWLCLIPLENWPWPRRLFFTAVFLLVFADPQYVQFFSAAYMDTASMVFLILVFAVAWNAALQEQAASYGWAVCFGLCGALFLGTKLQHEACAIPLAVFCFAIAWRAGHRANRIAWLLTPLAFIATAGFMASHTYTGYRVEPFFSAVFFKVLPASSNPEATLRELNRPATDAAFNHMFAYSAGSPLTNPAYRASFEHDLTAATILNFYLRHPETALQILRSDFLAFSADVPISSFGTMRRVDNPIPLFRASGPQPWSAFRRYLATLWPWHIPLLFVIVPALSRYFRNTIWPLAVAISGIGILSFLAGSLLDATETSRHIIIYQEATDLLYVVTFFLLLNLRLQLAERRILK